jgi:transposase
MFLFLFEDRTTSISTGHLLDPLVVGHLEGIDSKRGIASAAADSLALRSFLGLELSEVTPDHTTISRTRRLIASAA